MTAANLRFGSGHFYLTQLLIPLLLSGASHSPDGRARVINTSSIGHTMVSDIDFDTLREHPKRKKFGTHRLHYQSKFVSASAGFQKSGVLMAASAQAMVVFSNELQRRYGDQGIISVSLHPGDLKTDGKRQVSSIERMLSVSLSRQLDDDDEIVVFEDADVGCSRHYYIPHLWERSPSYGREPPSMGLGWEEKYVRSLFWRK